jgi:hypothetical protein
MAILERHVQNVTDEKAYDEWELKWEELEKRLGGFPAKRHYSMLAGAESVSTIVWEREWESFTAMEATYTKMMGSEFETLSEQGQAFVTSERMEFYFVKE